MKQSDRITMGIIFALAALAGCTVDFNGPAGEDSSLASQVADRALEVASFIGGADGFGGTMMNAYDDHAPMHMGFHDETDLSTEEGELHVRLHNDADEPATFDLTYIASHMGLDEQIMHVDVEAGAELTVDLPCAEIVGLGPLDDPGGAGCVLSDGETVDNAMAVPGFLGLDFVCGGSYECFLTPDVDDQDGDGDRDELVLITDALELHMSDGGPTGHMHGDGEGMMGPH